VTKQALLYAPHEIFSKTAAPVEVFDDALSALIKNMFEVMYAHQGVGLAANMIGILQRVIVIDVSDDVEGSKPMALVNPKIVKASEETQIYEEASLSFPGISAKVTRPKDIMVEFMDEKGEKHSLDAAGGLATVIQHEMDYLDGVVFLDHLSRLKRETLIKKMKKFKDRHHIDCHHHHHHH